MYSLETLIIVGFASYIVGVLSTLALDKKGLSIEQVVSLGILAVWIVYTLIAYEQERELSVFFNAAGMGAVGNLLGIKTTELIANSKTLKALIKKK